MSKINKLNNWSNDVKVYGKRSAQNYFGMNNNSFVIASACGSGD